MEIVKADRKGIELAVKYLKAGKAVVYPTDTAYGLGVDATNVQAVRRLYKIKGRSFKKPVHVIVPNFTIVKRLAMLNKPSRKLFKKFFPGPLTIVLELRIRNRKYWKMLSAETGTIGIRMSDNRIALALVKKFGKPITATSANISGGKTPYAIRDAAVQFERGKYQPDLYIDAGKLPKVKPSTIVKVSNNKIKVLRKGPLSLRQIQQAIKTK
ncbi:MAG: L-threonylcarbamoyladenylate synthase [bacterium]|nr:L-threonylcarbamoyladenylate synthase [bacterium]